MGRRKHPAVLLKELLCRFSGEDPQLISAAGMGPELVIRFAIIGALVLAIFILSFYSSTHFVSNLLNGSHFAAMPIGIVWGLMIVVIYQLLLFTITPAMLIGRERSIKGHAMPVTTEKRDLARVSLIFRITFVVLIAIVVAQPWLVTLFDTGVELERYRHKYRSEFIVQADSSLIGMEAETGAQLQRGSILHAASDDERKRAVDEKINTDLHFIAGALQTEQEIYRTSQKKGFRPDTLEDRLARMVTAEEESDSLFLLQSRLFLVKDRGTGPLADAGLALADLVRKKIQSCRRLDVLLSSNNFYTRKVRLVNSHHPIAWVVTLLVIFVFVMPIALKYHIRNRTSFYTEKKKLEEGIVLKAYAEFKGEYSKIFWDKFSSGVHFYESCTDPPFNTKKKEEVVTYPDEKSLLDAVYPNSNESEKNKYIVSENIS